MSMGREQERRLIELLGKLAARDAGEPIPNDGSVAFRMPDFGGQEHTDAVTLTHLGWITPRRSFGIGNVANSWSGEGIYAFDLTEDGREALSEWNSRAFTPDATTRRERGERPVVMMIHGSVEGRVPQVVEDIRLWCFDQGLEAYKAADRPNMGRSVREKVGDVTNEADYYIVVLTPDEELARGGFVARQNAVIEMGRVYGQDPRLVCVLKDPRVEMPSDYSDVITESLDDWESVLSHELRAARLL